MENFVIRFGIDQRESVGEIIKSLTQKEIIISHAVNKGVTDDLDEYSILFKDKWGIYFFGWNHGGKVYQGLVSKTLREII